MRGRKLLVYLHIAVASNQDRIDKTIYTHGGDANFEVGDVGGEAYVTDLVFDGTKAHEIHRDRHLKVKLVIIWNYFFD